MGSRSTRIVDGSIQPRHELALQSDAGRYDDDRVDDETQVEISWTLDSGVGVLAV